MTGPSLFSFAAIERAKDALRLAASDTTRAALSTHDVTRLATYNSEVARGLVHTEEYTDEMERLQRIFTRAQIAEADAKGWIVIGGEISDTTDSTCSVKGRSAAACDCWGEDGYHFPDCPMTDEPGVRARRTPGGEISS